MAGSVIDGEDLVQEALVKALLAFPCDGSIADPEAWLFRIAHNTTLNFLQRRARGRELHSDEDPNMIVDPVNEAASRLVAAASLRTLMRLSVSQRASVALMDVLGYTLGEIGEITGSSIAAIKADLHRGRKMLRELSENAEDLPLPVLEEPHRSRLALYIDRFNARDFDAVRDMLADDVRLELVNAARRRGRREVGSYLNNYSRTQDWIMTVGFVDRQPAVLVRDRQDPSMKPTNFILLEWAFDKVVGIRDFTHARYVIGDAELLIADQLVP
jgi:RNA polymerase sigma-70 factor, ECF subfamily